VDARDFGLLTYNRAFRDYSLQQRGKRLHVGQRPEDLLPSADYNERWRGYFQRALASGPFTTEYLAASGTGGSNHLPAYWLGSRKERPAVIGTNGNLAPGPLEV